MKRKRQIDSRTGGRKDRHHALFLCGIQGGAKFPSIQKIQDISEALGVPAYRLFIDQPEIEEIPPSELLDMFVEFLTQQYLKGVAEARAEFLKGLKSLKEDRQESL